MRDKIKDYVRLNDGIGILRHYDQFHRFYHNKDHIYDMVEIAVKNEWIHLEEDPNSLFYAILYHDVIYDSTRTDNEKLSGEKLLHDMRFYNKTVMPLPEKNAKEVYDAILSTANHIPVNDLSEKLIYLDLWILQSPIHKFLNFEKGIMKEYQWIDYSIYLEKRYKILEKLKVSSDRIELIRSLKPNIAVYPGSFNPFHIGHYDILVKAEQIFDKVIVARGINPQKSSILNNLEINSKLHRQIDYYEGLLTEYLNTKKYDLTIIRGIRNSTDLQFESNQYQYLQEIEKHNYVWILADKKYDHVSSSGINTIALYNKDLTKQYLEYSHLDNTQDNDSTII